MSSLEKPNYYPHIDGLRAIAVIAVVFFHLNVLLFSGGFVGVDVFFVISGFLITRLLCSELEESGTINLRRFYQGRIRRLFPALLVTLLVTLVVAVLMFSPSRLMSFGGSLPYAILGLSNHFFWLETDYFDIASQLKPALHTWSLSVEEQFYLIWPSVLLLLYKLGLRTFIPLVLIIFIGGSLYLNYSFSDGTVDFISSYLPIFEYPVENPKSTLFFLLPFRLFEFSIGALLVYLVKKSAPGYINLNVVLWLGLSMIGTAVLEFDDSLLFPSYYALLPCLGTALVIYAGGQASSHWVLTNKGIVSIGKVSYSLYLIHWPLIVFWRYQAGTLDATDQFLIVFLSLLGAYLSYRYVETPFRSRVKLENSNLWAKAAVAGLFLCMIAGYNIRVNDGWTWRINSPLNFESVGSASRFHRLYYGGAGYPSYGPVVKGQGTPDIVLMGDSHGRHYADGLYTEYANPKKLNLYIAAGTSCFHLPDFTRITSGYDWDKFCPSAFKTAIKYIKSAETPPLVVLSHSWYDQLNRAGLLSQEEQGKAHTVDTNDIVDGILKLKEMIGDATLVVIGQVPTTGGVNLYDMLTRPRMLVFSDVDVSQYLYSKPLPQLASINKRLREEAEESKKFVFIDPFDVLCDVEKCMNIDEQRRLLYSDTGHLSKYGSRMLVKEFMQQWKGPALEKYRISHEDDSGKIPHPKS